MGKKSYEICPFTWFLYAAERAFMLLRGCLSKAAHGCSRLSFHNLFCVTMQASCDLENEASEAPREQAAFINALKENNDV